MKAPLISLDQLEKIARFLDEHPGFSPLLDGPDALVVGFQVGGSLLSLAEMEKLVAAKPHSAWPAGPLFLLLAPAISAKRAG